MSAMEHIPANGRANVIDPSTSTTALPIHSFDKENHTFMTMSSRCRVLVPRTVVLLLCLFPTLVSAGPFSIGQHARRQAFLIRGGSSTNPFKGRVPAKLQRPFGQTSTPIVNEENDVEVKEMIDSFLTRDSRNSFISRVYAILSVQLVVTALSCVLFGLHPTLSNLPALVASGQAPLGLLYLPMLGLLISSVSWFTVCFNPNARRTSPSKWWLLSLFTLGESISVGFISSLYKFQSVVTAMGATALASITVSAYTVLQTNPNRDLSQLGASLSSWAMILLVYLFIGIFQQAGIIPSFLPFNDMLYSLLAACMFSAFLAYHTKLIVAGKHSKYRMNEKDYVYGAMSLYSDIISIFLYILRIIGEDKD